MSALGSRLAKLERALAPSQREFSCFRTVIIHPDDTSEAMPIADEEFVRLKAEGYQPDVDELIEICRFVRAEAA